ncbi:MAG: glycoside hydrolase family 2 TIM barrel-domain containing protein [Elusimicrobiota bacterium]
MKMTILLCAALCFLSALSRGAEPGFVVFDPGTDDIINYSKHGNFEGLGTDKYKYVMTDPARLGKAAGEGIYPNSSSVLKDPAYIKLNNSGLLNGSQWNFLNNDDHQLNFFKWATVGEEPGVKAYYSALALEKAGNIKHAVKAYYSIVVHFPKSVGRTYWNSPWYVGPVAVDKIKYLTAKNPGLGIKLVGAYVKVINRFDDDSKNDSFIVNPGRILKVNPVNIRPEREDTAKYKIDRTVGAGAVRLVKYSNGHWQLLVDGKPYTVKGMAYSPNKIGLSPDKGTLNVSRDWMFADFNKNGVIDGPYEAWVDANGNNKKDAGEENTGDFQLMKEMGVNTLRIYHYDGLNDDLLREGYEKYGFMYLMGNLIGMYCTDSGADWFSGTDYTDAKQREKMLDSVRRMVEAYKDKPYVLMWVLGNENNYGAPGTFGMDAGSGCRAKLQPEAYYKFVNEAARLVKSLDPQKRPVAICNGDALFLDICAKNAPDLDVFGTNCYRGEQGFGSMWDDVSEVMGKPVVITEYGCSAYHELWDLKRAEEGQAEYHRGNWEDIELNLAGSGSGNALGGVVFEWTDEWWKANADLPDRIKSQKKGWYSRREDKYKNLTPDAHDAVPQFGAPFLDGWSYEEWLGITGQGNGRHSPFMRQLRPAYFAYKEMWNK